MSQHPLSPLHTARSSLRGAGAQPVVRIYSLFLGGALLEVKAPVPEGVDMTLDLEHPTVGNMTISVRIAWCRPMPGCPNPVAAVEFNGSWDGLIALRHQLAASLGNRVFSGPQFVGYVIQEPNDPAQSCFDISTAKVALIGHAPQGGYSVRSREALPGMHLPVVATLPLALQIAFKLPAPPLLNVPGPPPAAPKAKPIEAAEEELLGMNTVVVGPDVIQPGSDDEELLGMNTIVLKPGEEDADGDDSRVLGGGRSFGPSTSRHPHSKIVSGEAVVGFVSRSDAESSWNLYSTDGKKLALLACVEGGVQICLMGTKADESLQFLQADNCQEALCVALELSSEARIDPELEGFH